MVYLAQYGIVMLWNMNITTSRRNFTCNTHIIRCNRLKPRDTVSMRVLMTAEGDLEELEHHS
jgi:hypothetical protein